MTDKSVIENGNLISWVSYVFSKSTSNYQVVSCGIVEKLLSIPKGDSVLIIWMFSVFDIRDGLFENFDNVFSNLFAFRLSPKPEGRFAELENFLICSFFNYWIIRGVWMNFNVPSIPEIYINCTNTNCVFEFTYLDIVLEFEENSEKLFCSLIFRVFDKNMIVSSMRGEVDKARLHFLEGCFFKDFVMYKWTRSRFHKVNIFG